MSDPNQSLLPLPLHSENNRPLPEIVADGNPDPQGGGTAFPLAYHDLNGKRYYAIQDWIRGVAQTDNPRRFWSDLKTRLKKAGIELSAWCVQLKYRASDRKNYTTDFTDDEGLYRITQRMDVNTGLRDRILNYLAKSGAFVDGQRIEAIQASQETLDEPIAENPDKAIEAAINAYKRMGRSERWIAVRMQSVVQRKRFTEAFKNSLRIKPSSFQYSKITDVMRVAMWKRDTQQLREEMGLDTNANLRDYETELGLAYETVAELMSEHDLKKEADLEFDQARQIVHDDAAFVGKQANNSAKRLGIDLPTGKPLLPASTKKR